MTRFGGYVVYFLVSVTNFSSFHRAHISNTSILLSTAGSWAAVTLQHFEGLFTSGPGSRILPGP